MAYDSILRQLNKAFHGLKLLTLVQTLEIIKIKISGCILV